MQVLVISGGTAPLSVTRGRHYSYPRCCDTVRVARGICFYDKILYRCQTSLWSVLVRTELLPPTPVLLTMTGRGGVSRKGSISSLERERERERERARDADGTVFLQLCATNELFWCLFRCAQRYDLSSRQVPFSYHIRACHRVSIFYSGTKQFLMLVIINFCCCFFLLLPLPFLFFPLPLPPHLLDKFACQRAG